MMVSSGRTAPAFAAVEAATPAAMSPSVYARAEAVLPQHVDELIYGLSVRPQWIGDGAEFWFERRTAEGRDYVLIEQNPEYLSLINYRLNQPLQTSLLA